MPTSFIPHVDDTSRLELLKRVEANGKLSSDFLALLAGSTIIATLGLFQNSPAVIIGAMIIAPLMRPLVCLSLASITADIKLLSRSILTLIAGSIIGMSIAGSMALLLKSLELTPEILSRTQPTLLDLGVALAAGAIGAFCQTNKKLADTLAGVAISVALVPPLSVVGIGLAIGNLSVAGGAALLYATNLVGITIAGALVFLFKGYSPLQVARNGLYISAAFILLLTVPLALSMRELILQNQISANVRNLLKEKTVTFKGLQLREVQVKRYRSPTQVIATVLSSEAPITSKQVKLVQDLLIREIGLPIEFKLRIIPAKEVTAIEVTPEGEAPLPTTLKDGSLILVPGPVEVRELPAKPEVSEPKELLPDKPEDTETADH
ncbi:MAG: TIGR00341 family protein [Candidatus Obscuribacter sp.]|jgi:uncharacterized hydrophobic protein (TIGR00271 family)|nr:TIGR00341 family protein [Candidatus Obscuribacter sp.]MBK9620775.1 TIGR00341 family protein [Candidatus Obscuribacter sp.]